MFWCLDKINSHEQQNIFVNMKEEKLLYLQKKISFLFVIISKYFVIYCVIVGGFGSNISLSVLEVTYLLLLFLLMMSVKRYTYVIIKSIIFRISYIIQKSRTIRLYDANKICFAALYLSNFTARKKLS